MSAKTVHPSRISTKPSPFKLEHVQQLIEKFNIHHSNLSSHVGSDPGIIRLGTPPNTLLIPEWLLNQSICTHKYEFIGVQETIHELLRISRCYRCEKLRKELISLPEYMKAANWYKTQLLDTKFYSPTYYTPDIKDNQG